MTVSANNSDDANANTIVKATGMNSLPSSPCNVSSGRKTVMMMAVPAVTGTATSFTAPRTMSIRLLRVSPSSGSALAVAWASTFSTTTTAASTSMPIAMARPPSDIRLAVSPYQRISTKVPKADSGRITATTSAARSWPRKINSSNSTKAIASSSALLTVLTARSTKLPRS